MIIQAIFTRKVWPLRRGTSQRKNMRMSNPSWPRLIVAARARSLPVTAREAKGVERKPQEAKSLLKKIKRVIDLHKTQW